MESQTSEFMIQNQLSERKRLIEYSASPLNGEAAELWDKDMELFKKKVLDRHVDIDDE